MRVASTCGVSGRCKKKGMFSAWCLLCPWAAQAEQYVTAVKEPAHVGWFSSEFVSSLAVSAFWSGKLDCLIIPTARTFSL